jgi:uncharacterized protein (TIGR02001 family)
MKKLFNIALLNAAIAMSCTTLSSVAQAGQLSGSLGFMSEYISRGILLSGGEMSMAGGLHYNVGNGVYTGFRAYSEGNANPYGEVDAYLGYNHKLANGLELDGKVLSYQFPYATGNFSSHFEELSVALRYNIFEVGIDRFVFDTTKETNIALGQYSVKGDMYYHIMANKPLPNGITIGGTIGYNDYDADNDPLNNSDFTHYQLTAVWKGFTLAVEHNDNKLFNVDKQVTVAWTKHFGL